MTVTSIRSRLTAPAEVLAEHRGQHQPGQRERRRQPLASPFGEQQELRSRAQFEFRANPDSASGPSYRFDGYAATVEDPFRMWDLWGDPYFETVAASAFNRTLANGCDTQFLVGHDESGLPMARTRSGTMTLSADSTGLLVVAPSLDGRNPQVQQLASAMERGDVDEMSIGFIAVAQQWSPDWMERRITEINLNRGDVSIVCWAANPNAAGASMEALPVSAAASRAAAVDRERRADGEAVVEPAAEEVVVEGDGVEPEVEAEPEGEGADEAEDGMVLMRARVRVLQLRG